MGVMQLVMHVQSTFGITVDPLEVTPGNFDSVNNLVNYILRKRRQSASDAG
jgi:acyl carrier protein